MITFPDSTTTNIDIQKFLYKINVPYSYGNKKTLLEKVQLFRDIVEFPWRVDQKDVIDSFVSQKFYHYVVNGIFGCGKTTMLMGIHIFSILLHIYKPSEAMFISFNVCIKNELKQKLKKYGLKTEVRTFDSIIYEICKNYDYPHLDLPNFDGKRKFVYSICKQILAKEIEIKNIQLVPKFIFIDECQDLESQTFLIFNTFFSHCQIVFTGDVFQSIQKEPKESLLWHLLNTNDISFSKHYMKETPRIPQQILKNLKSSLQQYYPEFSQEIQEWKSSSLVDQTVVEWEQFNTYTDIFNKIDEFLDTYPPELSMILTFSSAITVKGSLGDVARVRRYLFAKGIDTNKNHKKMDYDKLFLSTVNSSKGLERDYVLIVSTFPLERAFVNFSNDLVMNLITVGITRAKQKVKFLIPSYIDKFSVSLNNFIDCPKPNKEKIREDKLLKEFEFLDYYEMEHCVTEIVRQNIVKYDTRIKIQSYIKQFETIHLFEKNIPHPKLDTEEEKSLVGILIENLITSTWSNSWPVISEIEKLRNHPMYCHCFKRIEKLLSAYKFFSNSKSIQNNNDQFDGIFIYSQLHIGIYNKVFIDFSTTMKERLESYWFSLKPQVIRIRPDQGNQMKIQSNMKMPYMTGICDVMILKKIEEKKEEVTIWEIKASSDKNWKEQAMFQAILYAVMTGKNWCRLILLNPFQNEKCSYYFRMKDIMELRELVINDLLCWNINCYLAKNNRGTGKNLKVTDQYMLCMKESIRPDGITPFFHQITLLNFLSPTKIDIISNIYPKNTLEKSRNKMNKIEKLCHDSNIEEQDALKKVYEYLHSSQCSNAKIYYSGDCSFDDNDKYIKMDQLITKEENLLQMSTNDSFVEAICNISSLGKLFRLQ